MGSNAVALRADVLLVTATRVETSAVLSTAKTETGHDYQIVHSGNEAFFDLGEVNGARILLVQSEMGSTGPGGSTLTVTHSIQALSPTAVIMVGIAFGVNEEKQQLGQILVSQQLRDYEVQKVGTSPHGRIKIIARGARVDASPRLLKMLKAASQDWRQPEAVDFGLLLSGEKLIDNLRFRDALRIFEPEALGGEMEGVGVYAAAYRDHVDWIVVKAICDWADGKKHERKKERQERAASNAAAFIFHVLGKGGFSPGKRSRADQDNKSASAARASFIQWLAAAADNLILPGSNTSLPITKARARVTTELLQDNGEESPEDWIARYHEWHRLKTGDERKKDFDADALLHLGRRIAVVGGPGAGKSTILRRLAYLHARNDELVLWVRLPTVSLAMQSNPHFEDALLEVAVGNSGVAASTLKSMLQGPLLILADGLDETDPYRALVADNLRTWALGHPESSIVVTTRPIGHRASFFPSWQHCEVLPLDERGISRYALEFINLLEVDPKRRSGCFERLMTQLATNRTASLAARNPLLLGFLILCVTQGRALETTRAGLYRQIVEQAFRVELRDRIPAQSGPAEADAIVVLNWAGWLLLSHTGITAQALRAELQKAVMDDSGCTQRDASDLVGRSLTFWQDHRMLERLTFGLEEVFAFVHPSLAEYAAAQILAQETEPDLQSWLRDHRRQARWRETILLAAGCREGGVIETLLGFDTPDDPLSTEAILAAAALLERSQNDMSVVAAVIRQLEARLTAASPFIRLEALDALVSLAPIAGGLVGKSGQPLLASAELDTRLLGYRLVLEGNPDLADVDNLTTMIGAIVDRMEKMRLLYWDRDLPWRIVESVLWRGLVHLIGVRNDDGTRSLLERLAEGKKIALYEYPELMTSMETHGHDRLVSEARKAERALSDRMLEDKPQEIEADRVMLEAILHVGKTLFAVEPRSSVDESYGELASFITGMGWAKASVGEWRYLSYKDRPELLHCVLAGSIVGMGIDPQRLVNEAAAAQARLSGNASQEHYFGLGSLVFLTPVPAREWRQASTAQLDLDHLISALDHPCSPIARMAAWILAYGSIGEEAAARLETLLHNGSEQVVREIACISMDVWPQTAGKMLLDLLEAPWRASYDMVIRCLPHTTDARNDLRLVPTLLSFLTSQYPSRADAAARALGDLEPEVLEPIIPDLQAALTQWIDSGTYCEEHSAPAEHDSCPVCHHGLPQPRYALASLLFKLGHLDMWRFLSLNERSIYPARERDFSLVRERLARDTASTQAVLDAIREGKGFGGHFITILDLVLALDPEKLKPLKLPLLDLLEPSLSVRAHLLEALPNARWISREEALAVAQRYIDDPDHLVSAAAVSACRALAE